jgi:hypothetical protein
MTKKLFVRRARAIGFAMYGLSAAFVAAIFLLGAYADAYLSWLPSFAAAYVGLGGFLLLWALALMAYKFGRRATTKIFLTHDAVQEYIGRRKERLFVFLREFTSDSYKFASNEDMIAKRFQRYGTVLAVGKPGEPLPVGGSSCIYLDENWQSVVSRLIEQADVVLLQCGDAPGISWEFEQVIARKQERTVFIPSKKDKEKNHLLCSHLLKVIRSRPLDDNLSETMRLLRDALEKDVFGGDARARNSAQQLLESMPVASQTLKLIEAVDATLIRIKDGELVPVKGQLWEALDTVTRDLGLSPKPWHALKPWVPVAITYGPTILILASFLFCGFDDDWSSTCPALNKYGGYAFVVWGLIVFIWALFSLYLIF